MRRIRKIPWSLRRKGNGYKGLRDLFMAENPRCYWCGIKVIYFNTGPEGIQPNNFATIDHIKSRFERRKGEHVDKVLCCFECNQKRAYEDSLKFQRSKGNN